MKLQLKNTFINELPADANLENTRRQVENAVYSFVTPKKTANPKVLHVSQEMAAELGILEEETGTEFFKNIVTGNEVYPATKPFAMCYASNVGLFL